MISYCIFKTPLLGELLLVAKSAQLTGIYFSDRGHAPAIQSGWPMNPRHPVLEQVREELQDYLNGKRTQFSLSLHFEGTPFQKEIWRQISLIPFGRTITYSELAQRAGAPDAVRAAGAATGRNPLSIIIPCHRVVGKNNALTGYAGGLERKKRLLEIERTRSGQAMRTMQFDFAAA